MNEKKKYKKEKLSDEDSEWLEGINLNNCQNAESRKHIKQVLEELKKIDGLVMQKICTHDLSAIYISAPLRKEGGYIEVNPPSAIKNQNMAVKKEIFQTTIKLSVG